MKKILLIFVSVILLTVVFIYFSGEWLKIYEFVCEKESDETKQANCFLNLAKIQNDEEFCEKINNDSFEQDCHYYFAIKDEVIKLCEKSGEKEEECFMFFIEKYSSRYFCNDIKYKYKYRDNCYAYLAIKEKDLSFCNKMISREEGNCYEEVMKSYPDEDLCVVFEGNYDAIKCYYHLAVANEDVLFCSWTIEEDNCCREITGKDCIPDLTIEKVEARYVDEYEDSDTKEKYHRIRIDFLIKNIGSKDVLYFNAGIQIPEDRVDHSHVWLIERSGGHMNLKAQEEKISGYYYVLKSIEPIQVKALVDIDDHVKEENEDNNIWEGVVKIIK